MSKVCSVYSNNVITPENFKSVLDNYYKNQNLIKENDSFWSSSQEFNLQNYIMSALAVEITYLCCEGPDEDLQLCVDDKINALLNAANVFNFKKGISSYTVMLGTRKELNKWFATIGTVQGTNIGIISWRGTHGTNDILADVSPGFTSSRFQTCTDLIIPKSDTLQKCDLFYPPYFDATKNAWFGSTTDIHPKMLDIYHRTTVEHNGEYYSVYGFITTFYPNREWIITGHSLGAALAEFCVGDLASRNVKVISAYLFADPAPGNNIYIDIFNSVPSNLSDKTLKDVVYNIQNTKDAVSNISGQILWGRQLAGTTKAFDGPGENSPSGLLLAHSMNESYINSAIPSLFPGKSGDLLLNYVENYNHPNHNSQQMMQRKPPAQIQRKPLPQIQRKPPAQIQRNPPVQIQRKPVQMKRRTMEKYRSKSADNSTKTNYTLYILLLLALCLCFEYIHL